MYKPFEILYLVLHPFFPVLYQGVRYDLKTIIKAYRARQVDGVMLLDVGARKSHYTIGLPVAVTLLDVPQESDLQRQLNLGLTPNKSEQVLKHRSNVENLILKDFLTHPLPENSFDIVSAIEVIEHVAQDKEFVQAAFRVLKPGGIFYLTTPNGLAVKNTNPDHVRHYTNEEISDLLKTVFDDVTVHYGVKISLFYNLGLQSWTLKKPMKTIISMFSNRINYFQRIRFPIEAAHLVTYAVKRV